MILEATEVEKSPLEKDVQLNDVEFYHRGTHERHDENEVEPNPADKLKFWLSACNCDVSHWTSMYIGPVNVRSIINCYECALAVNSSSSLWSLLRT